MRQHLSIVPERAQQDRQQSGVTGPVGPHPGSATGHTIHVGLPLAQLDLAGSPPERLARQRLSHPVLRHSVQAHKRVPLDPGFQQRPTAETLRHNQSVPQLRLPAQGRGLQRGGQ